MFPSVPDLSSHSALLLDGQALGFVSRWAGGDARSDYNSSSSPTRPCGREWFRVRPQLNPPPTTPSGGGFTLPLTPSLDLPVLVIPVVKLTLSSSSLVLKRANQVLFCSMCSA